MALAARRGLRVGIADLSDGERATRGDPARRSAERAAAAEALSLTRRIAVGLPDGDLERPLDALDRVVGVLRECRPRTVLAPHGVDRHPDHEAAARLVTRACFDAGLWAGADGEAHRPRQWFAYMAHSPFEPSFVIDVTDVWEERMAAIDCYRSQFHPDGDGPATALSEGGFRELLEVRGRWFGAMIGARYGEPFLARGPIRLSGLPDAGAAARGRLEYSMW